MTFQEFTPRILEAVRDLAGPGREVQVQSMLKNNDTVMTGIMIRDPEAPEAIVPIQYLEGYYEKEESGVPIRHLARLLVETAEKSMEEAPPLSASAITSYAEAKEHIFCKLINTEKNAERLSDMPHRPWQDLSIVYYREIEGDSPYMGEVRITNALLSEFGVSEDVLHADAMKNTMEKHPFIIQPLGSALAAMGDPSFSEEDSPLYLLTTEDKCNGAICAAIPEALKQASETLGGDCFIIPSSIHEVLLLADDGLIDVSAMESLIRDINRDMVSDAEFLSDRAYYYDAKTEVISLAADVQAKSKQQEKVIPMPEETFPSPIM